MTDSDLLNIYDHEVETLQRIHRALKDRTYRSHNLNEFDAEITERFADAGFRVSVKWYDTDQKGVFIPEIEVIGRVDALQPGAFDHDKLRHEIVNNYLGLPESDAGIIPTGTYTRTQKSEHRH